MLFIHMKLKWRNFVSGTIDLRGEQEPPKSSARPVTKITPLTWFLPRRFFIAGLEEHSTALTQMEIRRFSFPKANGLRYSTFSFFYLSVSREAFFFFSFSFSFFLSPLKPLGLLHSLQPTKMFPLFSSFH